MRFTTNIQPTMWDMAQIYHLPKRKTLYDDKPWNGWMGHPVFNPNLISAFKYDFETSRKGISCDAVG